MKKNFHFFEIYDDKQPKTTMKKKTIISQLEGLEKVTEFLKLVILSSQIEGEKPLSCMIIAPVSSGKTTAIKQFKNNKNLLITTDSTAYGILKNYQNQLKNGEIRHILVPDLLNALARKKVTADQLLLFINASSEDGLFPSKSYGIELNQYIEPFGWILCLTDEGYNRKKKFLDDIGFLSRFFIIRYKYSFEQINKILENIINENNICIPDIILKTKNKKIKVTSNKKVFGELKTYSKLLSKNEGDSAILRMQKRLQTLVKASAIQRCDNKVTVDDLNKIKELIDIIVK